MMVTALLLAAALQGAAPELKPFEFQGVTAGEEADPGLISTCKKEKSGAATCTKLFDKVAGVEALTIKSYYQDKLSWIAISTRRENYATLLSAFSGKYGSPCATRTEKWQNRAGASLDNEVVEWCFTTGKLQLKAIGSRIDNSDATYYDKNSAPSETPPIDF